MTPSTSRVSEDVPESSEVVGEGSAVYPDNDDDIVSQSYLQYYALNLSIVE